MYFLHRCRMAIFLIIFLIFFTCILPTSSLRIGNCSTFLLTNLRYALYDVKIDGKIIWNEAHNVASVKQMKCHVREYEYADVNNFTLDITSMKTVRVQRFVEYKRKGLDDIVEPRCSLSFIYDYNTSLQIPNGLEDDIILHAERCIEKVLCKFDPEDHKIGDDIHVISTNRDEKFRTTTQATVNSLKDLVLTTCQSRLVSRTKLIIHIPKFEVSAYTLKFSSSGGTVDVLKYIKRDGDLSFQHEGHRYTVDTVLRSTGGYVDINDIILSSELGSFVKGRLPVNLTDATFRMKISLDYNQSPCKISAPDVVLNVATEQFDFSVLKIIAVGYEVTNTESVLNTLFLKSNIVSLINNQLADLLKTLVAELGCEDYRDLLFKLKKKV